MEADYDRRNAGGRGAVHGPTEGDFAGGYGQGESRVGGRVGGSREDVSPFTLPEVGDGGTLGGVGEEAGGGYASGVSGDVGHDDEPANRHDLGDSVPPVDIPPARTGDGKRRVAADLISDTTDTVG